MHHHQSPDIQSVSPGQSSRSGPFSSPGNIALSPQHTSSLASSPQLGMTHAPSSHFVSSGSFDFGGRLGSLGTTGLLPNLGLQPLELTEMELNSDSPPESETLVSPRQWGGYPQASTRGPAGPSGRLIISHCLCVDWSRVSCGLALNQIPGTACNVLKTH